MDLTQTIAPDSSQLNADDLIQGPVTVTIESVTAGNPEQPVNINVTEFPGRAYRPSKSMRRVLVAAWGGKSSAYVGRRLTLYRDPNIRFGREAVGGIRISHLSHIEKPITLPLMVSRGKREQFTVKPLPADTPTAAPSISDQQIEDAATVDELRELWHQATPEQQARIQQRVQELLENTDE